MHAADDSEPPVSRQDCQLVFTSLMMGLALGVGMLVDNAIVVLEAIVKRIPPPKPRDTATPPGGEATPEDAPPDEGTALPLGPSPVLEKKAEEEKRKHERAREVMRDISAGA